MKPVWRQTKNTFLYGLIRMGLAVARLLPFFVLDALGRSLAALGFLFARADRRRAVGQLRWALPELAHPTRVVFRLFVHFGRLAAEWVRIERFTTPGSPRLIFTAETKDVLRAALAEGRGVLFVTLHIGNWELLAQSAARHGFACSTVARETYDPRVTRLLEDFRARAGVVSYWRGDPGIMKKLVAVLKGGGILGVLIDQSTKVESILVPFFGRDAPTPIVPQLLAVRQRTAVVFGYAVRETDGRYRIHFERVPRPETGDHTADATTLTRDLTQRIEDVVRRYPEQWVWIHDRWRVRSGAL